MNITVTTIVYNEAHNIRELLEQAAAFASEIIVFDQSSTDGTGDIARSYTKNVFTKPNLGTSDVGGMKQEIINMAHGEWVFMLDGDEILSDELFDFIVHKRNALDPAKNGWWFKRRWLVDGVDTDILWPDWQHRLFKKTAIWPDGIHTAPKSEPSEHCDVGHIVHRTRSELILKRWKNYSVIAPSTRSFNESIIERVKQIVEEKS